jgi:uncharacterized 2Fe-2S/4Fe-4S cluster protein (DUF4445 family)
VFTPSGLSGSVDDGTTVLEAARQLGVDLDSVCSGRGVCGRCQVEPSLGRFDKWALTSEVSSLSESGALEDKYAAKKAGLAEGRRLGCDAKICGDVVLDVPPESQIHRQVVRKSVDVEGLVVDPWITLHYLELDPVDPEDGVAITTRIGAQLFSDFGLGSPGRELPVDPAVLPHLHAAAADDALTVAVASADGRRPRVIGAWAGFVERIVGAAIDVGSTTVAGHLCDLATGEVLASAGRMNPQIRFGEDLMSRVSYVMMNPDGQHELTAAIHSALDELVGELVEQAAAADPAIDRRKLLEVVLVGNPVMHHLFLGIDPTPLGQSPFTLATEAAVRGRAGDVGIDGPWCRLYVGPCIAGHVGADTAAAVLAEGPHRGDEMQLLVDVGTNAEIVLGDRTRQFAASSPTGPAFEGAQISAGQRATAGAIERVRIDRETLEPRFRVIGSDLWSDEDGFEEAVADSGVTGICGSGIIEVVAELFLAGIVDQQGVINGVGGLEHRNQRVEADGRTFLYRLTDRIAITQGDVRAIQLAKAALRAGIDLLIERAELEPGAVGDIRLAGAFGAHIDPVHAMILGLVPDCPVEGVRAVGNSAGSGALRALLSASERAQMESAVSGIVKIETATEERFQELFVAALAFPHATAPNPRLAEVVELPAPQAGATESGARPRRRRRRSSD